MLDRLRKSVRWGEEGATAVEYGIMVALIAAVIIVVVLALGKQVCEGFDHTSAELKKAGSPITTAAGTCP